MRGKCERGLRKGELDAARDECNKGESGLREKRKERAREIVSLQIGS